MTENFKNQPRSSDSSSEYFAKVLIAIATPAPAAMKATVKKMLKHQIIFLCCFFGFVTSN